MSDEEVAIRNRWRRLREGLESVRAAVSGGGTDAAVPDAVARALDAVYDLAEVMNQRGPYTNKTLEDLAAGDEGGETTLGLLCARGAKTHALADFGDLHTFGSHKFGEGPYGGGWAWQEFDDLRFPQRSAWYASRVQGRLVAVPLEVAIEWLGNQSVLSVN